jgi:hypothetical protein
MVFLDQLHVTFYQGILYQTVDKNSMEYARIVFVYLLAKYFDM